MNGRKGPVREARSALSRSPASTFRIRKIIARGDLPGTYEVQLIVSDGSLNSLPATAEIEVVSRQTQLTMYIRSLQQVIANLPASAFKVSRLRNDLLRKLNAVIESIGAREYRHAEQQLQDDLGPF